MIGGFEIMVTKRELAAAQQALNEAVAAFIAAAPAPRLPYSYRERQALDERYDEWDALRKQLDGQGPAVARSTSIAAGKANIMGKQSLRRTILVLVVNHWRQFHRGMTAEEIQARLKGKHQSVSARVSELVNVYGLLVDSGEKALTSSRMYAAVWKPTGEAIDLVAAATEGAE